MAADTSRHEVHPPSALPVGTRLGEFELLRVLGIGGFGIVYLALDHALEREVAVKEYMPASLAGRTETMHVSLRSQSDAETFELGRKSFVNEARLLARFDHPSLLKVHRFWEDNGTAYMAMPVYRGRTLKEVRQSLAQPPDEAWLRALLDPLLGAIEKLHHEGVYHRDIAPDNIVIEPDGRPVLLDFGAARRVIGDKSQTLTAILKPAYAPIEQYAEAGSVKQGPWTDFYALGATLHFMLLGRPPSPATARAVHDDQLPLAGQALPGCSADFLEVIDWMLSPRPADRPQSVAALRNALAGSAPPAPAAAQAAPAAPSPAAWETTQVLEAAAGVRRTAVPATGPGDESTQVVPVSRPMSVSAAPPLPPPLPPPPPPPQPPAPMAGPPAGRRWWPIALGTLVVAAVAGYLAWPDGASAPAAAAASAPAASLAAGPAAAPSVPAMAAAATVVTAMTAVAAQALPASSPAAVEPATTRTRSPKPIEVREIPPKLAARRPSPPTDEPTPARKALPVDSTPMPLAESPSVPPRAHPTTESVPKSVAPPSTTAALAGPTERCGRRVLLALWLCVQRECAKPELTQHPECVRWRAEEARRASPNR